MNGGVSRHMGQWRGWLIGAISAVFLVAALLVPAMPQPLTYHAFADCRTLFGVANFFNVVSNIPFLIGGVLGLRLIWTSRVQFIDAR
ncbi:MAG TPA: hypothetical protein VFS58_12280, partial [Steroidobacteraceae bacterium]|nr:hypothetical protein [Steroidobacteraceae bacterium]